MFGLCNKNISKIVVCNICYLFLNIKNEFLSAKRKSSKFQVCIKPAPVQISFEVKCTTVACHFKFDGIFYHAVWYTCPKM